MSGNENRAEQDQVVIRERRGDILWLTINRPEQRNAITRFVFEGLGDGLEIANEDPTIRAVVITGIGNQAFSAGADLRANVSGSPFQFDFTKTGHPSVRYFMQSERCKVPIIARVNGHARAGGFALVCSADLVVSVDHAEFGTPEAGIGIFPVMFIPYMLRILPWKKVNELVLTASPIDAAEAKDIGLVNYVVPEDELDAKVEWLIKRVVKNSPTAIRLGKSAMAMMKDMTLEQGFEFATKTFPLMTMTDDANEGLTAFREKRRPNWSRD